MWIWNKVLEENAKELIEMSNWTNDFRGDPRNEKELSFYVFDDLNAREWGKLPVIVHYDDLSQAIGAYRYLSTANPKWQIALGGELDGGALDFVQRREGKDVLLKDVNYLENWAKHPGVQQAVKEISQQLHLQDPSLDELKQEAMRRAEEKNERSAKSPDRLKGRGEIER